MPNCLTASVLFRAYLKRLPSGVFRVTVLSAALPRPLFRMYPAELGEAAAVERSVGHALVVLKGVRPVHAVDHLVMPPHADNHRDTEAHGQTTNQHGEVKSVFQHGSPRGLHQPCNNAAVSSEEQAGAEGYAVKGGHLVVAPVEVCADKSPKDSEATQRQANVHYNQWDAPPDAESSLDQTKFAIAASPLDDYPQPTQHLTLRVVWQGLL